MYTSLYSFTLKVTDKIVMYMRIKVVGINRILQFKFKRNPIFTYLCIKN